MILSFSVDEYATVCVEGGLAPYSFIFDGDTVLSQKNCMDYSLCPGNYDIEVYDFSSDSLICSKSITFTIEDIVAEIDQDLASVFVYSGGFEPFQYSWSVNGEIVEGENEAFFQGNFCPNSYECKITDQANCITTVSLNIDELIVNLTKDVECSDQDFEVLETNVIGGTSPYSYLWNTDETSEMIGDLNPITYSVSITDVHSCSIMEQVDVPVVSDGCLFDAFSPNGDQTNDVWTINPSFLFDNSEISIYNRWGAKVFESLGYSQPWDGTRKNGTKVAEGVYFYVIAFNNGVENTKGSISVFY
jgi:gliding motility-associated-like protein